MTPENPATDGLVNNQPRRYQIRRLHDSEGQTQQQIAERLGISQATVARDLKETVAPAGRTERGTPYYPPGRFNDDPEYQQRVAKLQTTLNLNETVARRMAAQEFAGSTPPLGRRGVVPVLKTPEEKAKAMREFEQGKQAAA